MKKQRRLLVARPTHLIRHIIHHYDAVCSTVVTGSDGTEPLLTCSIPLKQFKNRSNNEKQREKPWKWSNSTLQTHARVQLARIRRVSAENQGSKVLYAAALVFTRTRKTGTNIQKQKVASRGSDLGSAVCDWNTTAYSLAAPNRQESQGNLVTNQHALVPAGVSVTLRFGLILKMLVILIQFWATGRRQASEVSSCVAPCLSVSWTLRAEPSEPGVC